MSKTWFSHMAISCKDPIASERFYSRHFGFKRARVIQLGETQIVFLKLGEAYLELFQSEDERPAPQAEADGPHYPAWRHLAFQVEDMDAKLAEIGSEAVVTLGPLDFGDFIPGWRTVWIKDPDGNIVEISQGFVDQPDPPQLSEYFVVV